MNKEQWVEFYNKQRKTICYWAVVIVIINAMLAAQQTARFLQTGECRNYLDMTSSFSVCSAGEFVKNGWMWISFTDTFLLLPAAAIMVIATYAADQVFAKKP